MLSKIEALRESLLFSSVDKKNLPKFANIAQLKIYNKNELIFSEDEIARGFFIVVSGRVKIYKLSFSGVEHILHIITEGMSFAEAIVFGNLEKYPAFAEAISDCKVLFIAKRDFIFLIKADFSLVLSVLASLSEKLRYFNVLIEELSLKSAPARVAKYFLDTAFKKNSNSFCFELKKVELAAKLGIVPETLSRIFRKFKKQRIASVSKNNISILNKDKLQLIASGQDI